MAAILSALVPLIVALLPYMERAIEALVKRIHDGGGLRPGTHRRLARTMFHVGRLHQACERMREHATALGVAADSHDVGDLPIGADED